jgi:hypothetical protein
MPGTEGFKQPAHSKIRTYDQQIRLDKNWNHSQRILERQNKKRAEGDKIE